ncbi:cation transporting ATPase [Monoraphidium neglectum]|uniref:Cation transporting ATPase n=1 Tax=Monoraphidium neglectum TaxID=145388 RepID=A0A0D2LLP9_9CHLO|nr:cation transporting ATPase [Monoraphidium neglectum]KIY92699.1 cation transporting ATPase [Monoraphidium neglectum]|eukprot:XP_013891719.1 cation transporting ATPase [Monoraphidium neglectum]
MGQAKSKATTDRSKADIIQMAQGLEVVVQADDEEEVLPWHSVPTAQEVMADLASNAETGLASARAGRGAAPARRAAAWGPGRPGLAQSRLRLEGGSSAAGAAEAQRRLELYGPNSLTPPKKTTFLERLWGQLNNAVVAVLLAAAIVEGAMQSWAEFTLVILVIILNCAIGLFQEGKAEKAADAIKAMLSPTAKARARNAGTPPIAPMSPLTACAPVKRDGEAQTIEADTLVPGDVVLLKSGDKVPADVRIISANNLQRPPLAATDPDPAAAAADGPLSNSCRSRRRC